MSSSKNPENVIRGLKSAIHNPNVSETGKQHAAEQLREMGVSVDLDLPGEMSKTAESLGGHTVTTTKTAVQMTQITTTEHDEPQVRVADTEEVNLSFEDSGGDVPEAQHRSGESPRVMHTSPREPYDAYKKAESRVMGGYKAALHNPRVSKEAKKHAEEVLKEHGAEF